MITYKRYFAQYYSLYEYGLAFLIVLDFITFPYTSRCIPSSWNNIKSPLILHRQI